MKLKKVETNVKEILQNEPLTRDDDFKLYSSYIYKIHGSNAITMSFRKFMTTATESKMPPFESVTRARRKLQYENEELRGNKYNKRLEKQLDYIEYSKEV